MDKVGGTKSALMRPQNSTRSIHVGLAGPWFGSLVENASSTSLPIGAAANRWVRAPGPPPQRRAASDLDRYTGAGSSRMATYETHTILVDP